MDRLRNSVTTSSYVAPQRQTLSEFLAVDWLPAVRHQLARSTSESYDRNICNHVIPVLGGLQLRQIDGAVLNRFYATLLESGRKRGQQSPGLKARTVRYIHTIVHAALDDAVRWRRLVANPADQATPPSASAAKSPEMRVWTGAEVRRFLQLCEGDRYYFPFALLVLTGCRRGEVLGLRWADIDWERNDRRAGRVVTLAAIRQTVIPLTKASGRGREGRIATRTKSDKPRVIELDSATVAMLRKWREQQAEERALIGAGYHDNDLIFCRPDGRPYHPEAFSKTFDRRLRQRRFAQLPTIRLHDLRHTWATLALIAGVDVTIVSRQLGHSSPAITQSIYQHVVRGLQSDAAERVAALIFGEDEPSPPGPGGT